MARRFAKVSEEKIKTAFFYPSDLVNTKTTIPLRVGEKRWTYTSTLYRRVDICRTACRVLNSKLERSTCETNQQYI